VITCKRCGKSVQAGALYCPVCGLPLSNEQPELPAWLESLRTSERPAGSKASADGQAGYMSHEFSDEGALPSWMRSEKSDLAEAGNSAKIPAWRAASMPAPDTDSDFLPPTGFAASSLIDEQSLPSWLQEKQPGANQPAPKNIDASSLVQPDALPDWIRNLPQQHQSPAVQPLTPGNNPPYTGHNNQATGMASYAPAPQGFSSHELIDQQALPPWLGGQANSPVQANPPGQQAAFHNQAPASAPGQQGPQSGIGASSLLDMNSLPGWLRESEQGQERPQQASMQVPNSNSNGGNLTGVSLIDMNSLPHWLRASEEGQGQQLEPASTIRPTPYGNPPRVENVRVPSRPRGEAGPYEQSEVAANVFSSMLGVASTAPYFPSQPGSTPGYQQGFQGELFQQQPASTQMRQMPAQSPNPSGSLPQPNNALAGMRQGLPVQGYVPAGSQAYTPVNAPGMPGQQLPPYGGGASPSQANNAHRPNANSSGNKPARRGFIETIRSWFSH
jgi:hypothetical protein